MTMHVREPAVAGLFYPDDPDTLREDIDRLLASGVSGGPIPKAIVVPHAGYVFSGATAAAAFARLGEARAVIRRVVLLGPSHRVPFHGLALPESDAFDTPLGRVSLDADSVERIIDLPQVRRLEAAHAQEHSLEVELPFLQRALDEFTLLPLAVGDASAREVAEVLDRLWGGPETLIVVSSDLSHYQDYDTARRHDATTTRKIEALMHEDLDWDDACGRVPVAGLLEQARRRGLEVTTLAQCNSGDTSGDRSRVVGYGAYALFDA